MSQNDTRLEDVYRTLRQAESALQEQSQMIGRSLLGVDRNDDSDTEQEP